MGRCRLLATDWHARGMCSMTYSRRYNGESHFCFLIAVPERVSLVHLFYFLLRLMLLQYRGCGTVLVLH